MFILTERLTRLHLLFHLRLTERVSDAKGERGDVPG